MRLSLLLAGCLLASAATAQVPADSARTARIPPPVSYKDPGTATLISVLMVGGGHFYAGETETGLILVGLSLGAPLAGAYYTATSCRSDGFFGCSNDVSLTPLLVGLGIGIGAHVYGIVDAGAAAQRTNARNGYAIALAVVPSGAGLQPGLALTARF